MWKRMVPSNVGAAVVLIRLLVGAVFLSEGIQKFLFPDELGAGRFLKIGLPRVNPHAYSNRGRRPCLIL